MIGPLVALFVGLLVPAAAAQDLFIIPYTFHVAQRTPLSLALTESANFPELGVAPANAPHNSVSTIYGASADRKGDYEAHSLVSLPPDPQAVRYIYQPYARGWVMLNGRMPSERRVLAGAEAEAFLAALYLTAEERESFAPPQGSFAVETSRSASAFVCFVRCEHPGVTARRDGTFIADPARGPRAYGMWVYTHGRLLAAVDAPFVLVTADERIDMRTDSTGAFAIPDRLSGVIMLTTRFRRPPAIDGRAFTDHTTTLTLRLPETPAPE